MNFGKASVQNMDGDCQQGLARCASLSLSLSDMFGLNAAKRGKLSGLISRPLGTATQVATTPLFAECQLNWK